MIANLPPKPKPSTSMKLLKITKKVFRRNPNPNIYESHIGSQVDANVSNEALVKILKEAICIGILQLLSLANLNANHENLKPLVKLNHSNNLIELT